MAKAHISVRVQARGTNAQMHAIKRKFDSLKGSVEGSGNPWTGGLTLELDEEAPPEGEVAAVEGEAAPAEGEAPVPEAPPQ